MKKFCMDMRVDMCKMLNGAYALLLLTPAAGELPNGIVPGQFVQIDIPGSKTTFLRRPISICFVDYGSRKLWLLVRDAGAGTHRLITSQAGDTYSVILPLGNGFSIDPARQRKALLVGGGVGVAPLLYLGKAMGSVGIEVKFALGARSEGDLLLLDEFKKYGEVHLSTEDGTMGQQGFVTGNTVFDADIDHIACCGPTPMMQAVARIAHARGINCEVSLENMMACGLGACLCCVEDTRDAGNVCVCTDGPVFNINRLKWEL